MILKKYKKKWINKKFQAKTIPNVNNFKIRIKYDKFFFCFINSIFF